MSKIHKKTGSVCMICDEQVDSTCIIFHKTRRQTHVLCQECGIGYLKPIIKMAGKNIRMNIMANVGNVKCPGTYHSKHSNHCNKTIQLSDLKIPECEISLDVFRIVYVLSTNNSYLCPEEKCGHITEVDMEYPGNNIICHMGCQTSWCRQCLATPYHVGKSCLQFELESNKTENGKFICEMKNKGRLKFCPQCRAPCIKNSGCNKMLCSQCNCKWCWICLADNIDYDHYNYDGVGSCIGKLWKGFDENGNIIDNENYN